MYIFFTISVVILTTIVFQLLFWRYRNRKYLTNVPGPKPNFFIGNMDMVLFLSKDKILDLLMNLFEAHGPIVKLHIGPKDLGILTADVRFIEYILSSNKLLDKGDNYGFIHNWLGTGLLTSSGSKWKKRRRMLTPSFHYSILEHFVDVFENVGDIFIQKLEKEIVKNSVDVFPLVTLYTLDVICEAAMGTKLNALNNQNSEYVKSVKDMCAIFTDRTTSIVHSNLYPLTLNYYREKRALKVIHGHAESIINKRITELSDNMENEKLDKRKKLAFLDLLLKSTIDGEPLSKRDIREEVDTFMFAGHDTTATAISFALYSLAVNPEVQEKAYQEQLQIFGRDLKTVKPKMTHLQEMKYLEMVLKETLRLYPPVPVLARKFPTDEDIEWDGHVYPKGLNVSICIYGIHRNPEYFPDPLKFNPERFKDSNRANVFVFLPFSAGPRSCIGQKFAMLEMKSVVSKVLRNFELLPTHPIHEPKLFVDIVLSSVNGICLTLRKRRDE